MATLEIPLGVYIGLAVSGIFSGIGTAIGTYLAQTHFIKRMGALQERIQNGKGPAPIPTKTATVDSGMQGAAEPLHRKL